MEPIGWQNGVAAARARMKKLDPAGFREDGTGAWDKFFATIGILVRNSNDLVREEMVGAYPYPPPPPPPTRKLAPQTYNKGSSGQNARFSIRENCSQVAPGIWQDAGGFQYDDGGRCRGGRSEKFIAGLKPADMMDGKEPYEPYSWGTQSFPPWPAASYEV